MLVSVVIPCHNVEDYISECLDSVILQTYSDIEIIIVDNNSTDDTKTIAEEYALKYSKLVTVLKENRQGVSYARNKGLAHATGSWIQFLDADDLLFKDKIARQVELIKDDYHANILISGYYFQDVNGDRRRVLPKVKGDFFVNYAFEAIGQTSANLVKRTTLQQVGGWVESYQNAEDTDLFFKIAALDVERGIVFDTYCHSIYRIRKSGQITTQNFRNLHLNSIRVRYWQYNFLSSNYQDLFFRNKKVFQDMIYYPIYQLGIHDLDLAEKYMQGFLGENYCPSHHTGIISIIHVALVKIFGFRKFMKIRKWMKCAYYFLFKT